MAMDMLPLTPTAASASMQAVPFTAALLDGNGNMRLTKDIGTDSLIRYEQRMMLSVYVAAAVSTESICTAPSTVPQ
jgi:hypothetical protein